MISRVQRSTGCPRMALPLPCRWVVRPRYSRTLGSSEGPHRFSGSCSCFFSICATLCVCSVRHATHCRRNAACNRTSSPTPHDHGPMGVMGENSNNVRATCSNVTGITGEQSDYSSAIETLSIVQPKASLPLFERENFMKLTALFLVSCSC